MNSGEEGRVPEKRKVPGTVPEMVLASVREFPPDHPVQASAHFPYLPEKVSVHLILVRASVQAWGLAWGLALQKIQGRIHCPGYRFRTLRLWEWGRR